MEAARDGVEAMTEYTVGLKYIVNSAVGDPVKYVDRLSGKLDQLEARNARSAGRAGQRAEREQHQLNAQAIKSSQQMEDAKRNAAFRRLRDQQREEERFTRYRITLDRRLAREKERSEQQQLRASQQRIAAQQREEAKTRSGHADDRRGLSRGIIGLGGRAIGAGLTAAAGGAAYTGYQAVNTARFIENSRMRLTAQLGSKQDANAEIRDSLRIAEKTIFDPDQVIDAVSKLAINFKDVASRRYILGAVSDFATATGEGNEGLERSIRAISQIAGKGKVQQEELTGQLGELGLSATKVYDRLAVLMDVKGKNDQEKRDKVIKAITAGKVGSNQGIQAITDVMRDGRDAGSTAVGASGTLDSQLSNLKKGLLTLYAAADIENWPAMLALKGLLKDISDLFSVDSDDGQQFMQLLNDVSAATIVPFLNQVRESLKEALAEFRKSPQDMGEMIRGLIKLVEWGLKAAGAIGKITANVLSFIGSLTKDRGDPIFAEWSKKNLGEFSGYSKSEIRASAEQKAGEVPAGMVEGLRKGQALVLDAATGMVRVVPEAMSEQLQIHSPSRVTEDIGMNTVEGFALGLRGGVDRVGRAAGMLPDAATSMMRPMAYPVGGGGMSGGGRPSLSVAFTLPVVTAQDPAELTKQAMPLIMAQFMPTMDRYFGRVAAQGTG